MSRSPRDTPGSEQEEASGQDPGASGPPVRTWKCTLEYDGSRYFGWQRQPAGRPTVQEELEKAASQLANEPIAVAGSGRTDTGVHAYGQVASFRTAAPHDGETFHRGLNALLPRDVRILRVDAAAPGFHARFDARGKRYEYRVDTGPIAPVFELAYRMHLPRDVDVAAMQEAARHLVGTHDFRAFCRRPPEGRSTVRSLTALDICRRADTIVFALEANGFLHTMVRSIVGTLLLVGTGKSTPRDVAEVLAERDRSRCGPPAPPQGLFLMEVFY